MEGLEKYYRITLVTDSVMAASHSTVVLVPFSISEAIYNVIMYTKLIKNIMVTYLIHNLFSSWPNKTPKCPRGGFLVIIAVFL